MRGSRAVADRLGGHVHHAGLAGLVVMREFGPGIGSRLKAPARKHLHPFAGFYPLAVRRNYQKTICAGHGHNVTGALPRDRRYAWGLECLRRIIWSAGAGLPLFWLARARGSKSSSPACLRWQAPALQNSRWVLGYAAPFVEPRLG